jgi:non-ribosomal peptide synthetase component F
MDEARAVLARLERIEAFERAGAGAPLLLPELRELVREATEWAERERDPRALQAAAALASAGRDEIAVGAMADDPSVLT